jgi:molybdenum cofactor cytidylyltransferase
MIVATGYSETFGVPILIDKKYFNEFLGLQGDQGGKGILKRYQEQISTIFYPRGDMDIDTPNDLNKIK